MKELVLDGSTWQEPNDLYNYFFAAVGAPEWHGRNLDALVDSIETGGINNIEVPYRVVVQNVDLVGPKARQITSDFVLLLRELAARGCPVQIETVESQ